MGKKYPDDPKGLPERSDLKFILGLMFAFSFFFCEMILLFRHPIKGAPNPWFCLIPIVILGILLVVYFEKFWDKMRFITSIYINVTEVALTLAERLTRDGTKISDVLQTKIRIHLAGEGADKILKYTSAAYISNSVGLYGTAFAILYFVHYVKTGWIQIAMLIISSILMVVYLNRSNKFDKYMELRQNFEKDLLSSLSEAHALLDTNNIEYVSRINFTKKDDDEGCQEELVL